MPEDSKYVMRCHYEVLELEDRKAEEDEIRRNYKKLCLRLHPDKNRENIEEATIKFKEVQNSYAVLIDPDERAWYDNHREKILRGGDPNNRDDDDDEDYDGPEFLNLWKFFGRTAYTSTDDKSEKGFYGVFNKVFNTIFEEDNEWLPRGATRYPLFGDADTEWPQVNQFYQFWQSYSTKKSYAWKDEYKVNELPDRQMRRAAEKINAGHREAAKREYSRTVQSLVDQVRRNDPRVEAEQQRLEARMKMKEEEREKKQEEALRRRAEERKRWMEEAKEQEKESMVTIAEETEVLEQLYAMRTSNKPKQPPKQPQTPLYTKDEHGNEIKIVPNEDDEDEEEEQKKKTFKCEYCKKTLTSQKLYDEHCNSNKHKTVLKKLGIDPKTMRKFGEAAATDGDGEEGNDKEKEKNDEQDDKEKGDNDDGKNDDDKEQQQQTSPKNNKKGKKGGNNNNNKTAAAASKKPAAANDEEGSDDDETATTASSTQQPKLSKKQKKQQQQQQALQAKAKQAQQMKNLAAANESSSDDDDSSSDDGVSIPSTPTFQTGSSKKKKRR